jgi:hypothetical protein
MKRRTFLQSAAVAGGAWAISTRLGAAPAADPPAADKLVGMYVHEFWTYHHPYAARTWTYEDWHGYLDGLHRLGFNLVAIWPVVETMPSPPTPSDKAALEKMRRVIDAAHQEFHMKVWICLCANIVPIDEHAGRVPFERRHSFYADARVDPADAKAVDAMMLRRETLLAPLAQADALMIIDSDPGGYPNSTNQQFVDLLMRHRRLLDRLRPGVELIYWMWAGWPAYARYYATGSFAWGTENEFLEALTLLKQRNPEPWGLARGLEYARPLGLESKVINLNYGAIEGEPSFPMTNFGGNAAYQAGRSPGPRGVMGNAQTHCVQLPNTFAFARGAGGLPLADQDYLRFADDLIPGQGPLIFAAWQALSGSESGPMRQIAGRLAPLVTQPLAGGPLKGLLFGSPRRFVKDLYVMLRTRAAFLDFTLASQKNLPISEPYAQFVEWLERWQLMHGYECEWTWPGMQEALDKLNAPSIAALARETDEGNTPFDRVKTAYYRAETRTSRLIQAMKQALWEVDPRFPDSSARFGR